MFQRILIPVDKDKLSERTTQLALEFAKRLEAHITLVYALIDFVPDDFGHQVLEPWRVRAEALGLRVQTRVADGYTRSIGDAIAFEADQNGCDLILMGTHGRQGVQRLLLGSVAERVTRVAKIPVMLCRDDAQFTQFKRILVPVDGSPPSFSAIEMAKRFAQHFQSELQFVHVIGDAPLPIGDPMGTYVSYDYEGFARALEVVGKDALETASQRAKNFAHTTKLLRADGKRIAQVLIETAKQDHADLIIMGTHGRGGFERWLLGSVAEGVAHRAPTPVLLTRA
jgi:nucleotide-binding universal stress UspA family protein